MKTPEQNTYAALKRAAHLLSNELEQPNWERRRYLTASLILTFCASDAMAEAQLADSDDYEGYMAMADVKLHCKMAIDYADELIRQLKGNEQ